MLLVHGELCIVALCLRKHLKRQKTRQNQKNKAAPYAAHQYLVLFIVNAKVDISWLYRLLLVWRWAAPKGLRCGAQAVDTLVEAVEADVCVLVFLTL